MPEMSGPEVGREVTRLSPGTRLLYISGYADEASSITAFWNPERFLQKPFLPHVLAAKVRQVLDAGREPGSRGNGEAAAAAPAAGA